MQSTFDHAVVRAAAIGLAMGLVAAGAVAAPPPATQTPRSEEEWRRAQEERQRSGDRRIRRVRVERVVVTSPDGRIELAVLPNAERPPGRSIGGEPPTPPLPGLLSAGRGATTTAIAPPPVSGHPSTRDCWPLTATDL